MSESSGYVAASRMIGRRIAAIAGASLVMMLWTAPPPARECHRCGAVSAPMIRRSQIMQTITTIGLDIAKSVFQVHGVDANGDVVVRRQLKRRYVLAFFQKLPPCLV